MPSYLIESPPPNAMNGPESNATPRSRESVFDLLRGIGILVVLVHHSSNNSSRLYTGAQGFDWWFLTLANRLTSFSVPLFLLVSSILSARAFRSRPEIATFFKRRLPGILWPYFVWTFLFWMLNAIGSGVGSPSRRLTSYFSHPVSRLNDLIWGKAAFHLYFLVILVQVIVILPGVINLLRRRQISFPVTLLLTAGLQVLIFVLQHHVLRLRYPASTFLWYVGSWLPGVWVGYNWTEMNIIWHRWKVLLGGIVLVSLSLNLWQSVREIHHLPIDNYLSNGSLAVYTSCAALCLLGLLLNAERVNQIARVILEWLGQNSLEIYLIHPALMVLFAKPSIVRILQSTPIGPLCSFVLLMLSTLAVIFVLRRTKLQRVLFGRG